MPTTTVFEQGTGMTRTFGAAVLMAMCSAAVAVPSLAQDRDSSPAGKASGKDTGKDPGRPDVSLKVTPLVAFSPAKITVRAEFRGGALDYEPFYCTTIVWDWDDGTTSENTPDCAPYEPGKSEIRRYISNTHTYTMAGRYNVRFRMKKGERVVGGASTLVQVRAGIRDMATEPPFD
jgi:hypothetical protein